MEKRGTNMVAGRRCCQAAARNLDLDVGAVIRNITDLRSQVQDDRAVEVFERNAPIRKRR